MKQLKYSKRKGNKIIKMYKDQGEQSNENMKKSQGNKIMKIWGTNCENMLKPKRKKRICKKINGNK